MALQITDSSSQELLAGGKPVVMDFWAEWCGPCRMIGPYVEELAEAYKDRVVIGKVNVDENDELPGTYGIRNIPTLLFFKDGALVDKLVGATSKAAIEEKIKKLL
ncbi:MAG: thioredoxin [Dysgonamonadaceae bacterium]|jgi:thioredoxin 1|nr:thioredoxin [Dysgonamonadaceae bacterium]